MKPIPLTRIAQQRIAERLGDGDLALDATVGNGNDTLFLARQVGTRGHVWGFDVQASALAAATALIAAQGLTDQVTLVHAGHQDLAEHLPTHARGRLGAAMFNLGYLPGSDKRVTTSTDTTLTALAAAAANLAPGGLLSVVAYRGHPGGQHESDAVQSWLHALAPDTWQLSTVASPGPVLYQAVRLEDQGA